MSRARANRGRWAGLHAGWASGALAVAGVCFAQPAHAETTAVAKKVAVGFSNLVARIDNDEIGIAKAQYRVHILEALRGAGYNAVGAENLVFDKDEAERADIVLGGTVKELKCQQLHRKLRCSVGVEWQLLDRESDAVVYRVMTRFAAYDLPQNNAAVTGKQLIVGALGSLMRRPRFVGLLNAEHLPLADDQQYPAATFARCASPERSLPADFEAIASGTVVIKAGQGTGSGFVVSPDGLLVTAAHVATAGRLEAHTRDGKTFPAHVVRISRKHDVALLSLGPSEGHSCLALEPNPQAIGAEVYAIGAPGGAELGFSLSRGIVSGLRSVDDVPLVQTDASLSPGNSGGPLVDAKGRVVGVVSRKIAGQAVEGLGFAIPIQAGMLALHVEPGDSTSDALHAQAAQAPISSSKASIDDTPDGFVSLDPEGDLRRARAADLERRVREQKANTPAYVSAARWGGLGLGCIGSVTVLVSWMQLQAEQGRVTRQDYESRRLTNDLGWVGTVVGFGAFGASYILEPKLGPSRVGATPRWSVAAGPTNVELNVRFQ